MSVLIDAQRRLRSLSHQSIPTDRVLIIQERAGAGEMKALEEIVPENTLRVNVDSDTWLLRSDIFKAVQEKAWLIVNLQADLSPDSITAIKELSRGAVHGEDGVWHSLPNEFRFIAVIEREAIQRQSYPNFLNIFDTAISIT